MIVHLQCLNVLIMLFHTIQGGSIFHSGTKGVPICDFMKTPKHSRYVHIFPGKYSQCMTFTEAAYPNLRKTKSVDSKWMDVRRLLRFLSQMALTLILLLRSIPPTVWIQFAPIAA